MTTLEDPMPVDATATVPLVQPVTRDDIARLLGYTGKGSLRVIIERAEKLGHPFPAPVNPDGEYVYDEDAVLVWSVKTGRVKRISDPAKKRRAQRLATTRTRPETPEP